MELKLREINTDDVLRDYAWDLLETIRDKVQIEYKNVISVGRYVYQEQSVLLFEKVVTKKRVLRIFKYNTIIERTLVTISIKDNKMTVVVSDYVIYPIIKKEFTDFVETNKIDEIIFKKNFYG